MKRVGTIAVLVLLSATVIRAQAAPITFVATDDPGVSGFVTFDDAVFDGSAFQFVSNTAVLDLALTAFGAIFTTSDVVTAASTFINSSGPVPLIVNGSGLLAYNGSQAIAFFPDGFGGTALDGDASLAFSATGVFGEFTYHQVRWVVPAQAVPEPTGVALVALGLAGLCLRRRIRS
jgi:hypothetical protein